MALHLDRLPGDVADGGSRIHCWMDENDVMPLKFSNKVFSVTDLRGVVVWYRDIPAGENIS